MWKIVKEIYKYVEIKFISANDLFILTSTWLELQ